MNCPVCENKKLHPVTIQSVQLDICSDGCQGIWFDQRELKKFDEAHESAEGLIEANPVAAKTKPRSHQLHCPQCKNIVMIQRFSSVKKKIELDECGKCAGIWTDAGELTQLRNEFKTENERRKAADLVFDDLFSGSLNSLHKESSELKNTTKRIANAFRFISPSYYISGKQKWGAF